MSGSDTQTVVVGKDALYRQTFSDTHMNVFAVLDGAAIPDLLDQLYEHTPEHVCLYRGELAPDLAECAPYLVRLAPETAFSSWVLENGWGQHWGIFAITPADLRTLRKHFRTFLMVKDPEGKPIYFRYYDPRVLRVYLPTCNAQELQYIFGPVHRYVCEGESEQNHLSYCLEQGALRTDSAEIRRNKIRATGAVS